MTVYQACQVAKIRIPKFCYHEALKVSGNCRMCLVEIKHNPKLVPACAFLVAPGMKIITKSERVRIARGYLIRSQ
jgi:NADH dehydrogenase/NADH:ubiquinone oxidoreductase subunit G